MYSMEIKVRSDYMSQLIKKAPTIITVNLN